MEPLVFYFNDLQIKSQSRGHLLPAIYTPFLFAQQEIISPASYTLS